MMSWLLYIGNLLSFGGVFDLQILINLGNLRLIPLVGSAIHMSTGGQE